MKSEMRCLVLFLLLSVCMHCAGFAQSVYTANLQKDDEKPTWDILYKKDVKTNELVEFYKYEDGMIGRIKVSPDGEKIGMAVSYAAGVKSTGYITNLEIVSSDGELVFSLDELTDYHVMDFTFDPTSRYVSFVAGITNPHKDADFSTIPAGFGIIDIERKSIEWIVGGPENIEGQVIKSSSWPQGGFIYAYGYTNDDNRFVQNVYKVDPETYEKLNIETDHGDYAQKMFKINASTYEITVTDLPIEQIDSFSPDGKYYFSSSMFSDRFGVYDTKAGEDVSGKLYDRVGDTLFYFGMEIEPRWMGNSGSVLGLEVQPTGRYDRGKLAGFSQWIFDMDSMDLLYENHKSSFSLDLGFYWTASGKDYVVKRNDEFDVLDSDIREKIDSYISGQD